MSAVKETQPLGAAKEVHANGISKDAGQVAESPVKL